MVYQQIDNGNTANQIHAFTIDYGKFILISYTVFNSVLSVRFASKAVNADMHERYFFIIFFCAFSDNFLCPRPYGRTNLLCRPCADKDLREYIISGVVLLVKPKYEWAVSYVTWLPSQENPKNETQ